MIPITFSSTFLHKKQNIGAYFSTPLFHHVNDMVRVIYVVFDDGHIILPNTPQMTLHLEGNNINCDQSLVVCSNLFPDEKLSKISFTDFMDRVPAEKKSTFDITHTLINPMSIEELRLIFR